MAWNSTFSRITTKSTGDNLSAADVNLLNDNDEQTQANIEALAGNGTSAPDRTVQECSVAIDGISAPSFVMPGRNSVQVSSLNASGHPNFITAGTGLSAALAAASVPFVVSFANGFLTSPYDYIYKEDEDQTISDLTAYANNYLYADYNSGTGTVTYGKTLYPYYAESTFIGQRIGAIHAPFNGTNGATTYTDAMNNTWTLANGASLTNSVYKYQTTSLYLQGTDDYAETAAPDMSGLWTIESWIYPTDSTRAAAQVILYSNTAYYGPFLQLTTAGKLQVYLSSNGSSWDIANGTTGSTVLSDNTWAYVAVVFTGAAYKVYLNGAEEISVTSSSSVYQPKTLRLGVSTDGTSADFYGYMEDFRFSPYAVYTAAFTAPTAALSLAVCHFFDTNKYIMYYGNPSGWTSCSRVYLGEALCGASSVSSVVNYALKGTYNSRRFTITTNTLYTKSHYLGTQNYTSKIMCTAVAGAQLADAMATWNGSSWIGEIVTSQKRNTVNMRTMAGGTVVTNDSGTTVTAVEAEIRVWRGF